MIRQGETIAAIASGAAPGGIGVLRISGEKATSIATILLGRRPRPRHAHFARFHDAAGELLDTGVLIHFPAPASFTGEDVLELHGHGNPISLRRLLERCLELGARHARPGEFSERAFLNGKIDLAQAEAIADLIASQSSAAASAAVRSLEGEFSRRVEALVEAVTRLRVWIEAAIDFAEEEIDFLAAPALHEAMAKLRSQHAELLGAARQGVRLADGLHVVIIGRPNAGKSSLLNALAASERAIVTAIPGTTRDVLRETIDLDGIAITLVDTAGLRESEDPVEQEGIRRARAELERADLVILVANDPIESADLALLQELPATLARIVVHSKIDLSGTPARREERADGIHLWLSAHRGDGLPALIEALRQAAGLDHTREGAFSARQRHVDALVRAAHHIDAAHAHLQHGSHGELSAEELRQAQQVLGEITGTVSSDDLLGRIFADFCIGK